MIGRNGNSVEGEMERERKDSNINVPLDKFKYHSQFGEFDTNFLSFEIIKDIANYLLERTSLRPKIGIICGSGLDSDISHARSIHLNLGRYLFCTDSRTDHCIEIFMISFFIKLRKTLPFQGERGKEITFGHGWWASTWSLADGLQRPQGFQYEEIPHFPVSTVKGHAGRLVFGMLEDVPVVCMQGRFHCYEGYPLWKCAMPVRLMKMIGVTHLIVTNAAGGLSSEYKVGDIMIIKDHINMMGFAGNSALNGPNDERFGPRFPAMNKAYDAELRSEAKKIAFNLGMKDITHEGIYTCLGGPSYETIAELRMLKRNGVDAVGMSTIPEVITAKHCGLTVFAFSLITNACILDYEDEKEANHEEVVETGKQREPLLKQFVSQIVLSLHKKGKI